jgi:hypothetical protein
MGAWEGAGGGMNDGGRAARDARRSSCARAGRAQRGLIYSYLTLEHEKASVRNGAGFRAIDAVTTNAYALLLETRTGAHEGSKGSEDD